MGLFSKKDKEKKEKPKKPAKNAKQEPQQSSPDINPEDEMKRLDSNLGLELLYQGYMMIPQKRNPNGEILYLNVITKHTPMFYASDSIQAYEQFGRKMQEQNGGLPDKVQCKDIKNGSFRDYSLSKTTFSDAVKILDSTESEGFLYLLQDGRGLVLSTRMVRELARRYSILQEMKFEEEQRRQKEEYDQKVEHERSEYNQAQQYEYNDLSQQHVYSQQSMPSSSPQPIQSPQSDPSAIQPSPTYSNVDGRLRKHFENMLDRLGNVDAFNLWSAAEIYSIGYVMEQMYKADYDDYKATIKTWAGWAKNSDKPMTLALMIMDQIVEALKLDYNATEKDVDTARGKCTVMRQRSDEDISTISFGIAPKHVIPKWCVEACNEYAAKKREELQNRFINTCVEEGMNDGVARKYYDMLSNDHKLVLLELDYCLRTNKFKRYGAQMLPDPKTGEMMTIETMLKRRNPTFQENDAMFKRMMISGYIRVVEAGKKFS